ncbi:MAG: hypothetical protein AB8B79_12660 [Granulosicoccus sp.]
MMIGVNQTVTGKFTKPFLKVLALLCTVITAYPTSVLAATVDSEVSVVRSESTKISNIDDWLIGVFASADSINNIQYNWDWQCVYTSTGTYRVEVTSQNGGSALKLESGAGDQMNYWIYSYVRRGNAYELEGHTSSVINLNNLSGSQSLTCADENVVGTNLWFAALVRPADFNPAPPGVYRDVVTLVVSPE